MDIILKPPVKIWSRIGSQERQPEITYTPNVYTISLDVDDGKLVYNTLTRELLFLPEEEYTPQNEYLINHWFFVDENINPYTMAYMLKKVYRQQNTNFKMEKLSTYTIMTTTSCNAKCYYCYEAGCRHRDMSLETAEDVADFIERTSNGWPHIQWFGGEPLCNAEVIDIISGRISEKGIPFSSSMASNAYLFNTIDMDTIKSRWHLERVQVTLDGLEEMHNQIKGIDDAFEQTLDNIGTLASSGIVVSIRLNLSGDNMDDMKPLIDILQERFSKYKNVSIYSRPLFGIPNRLSETDDGYIKTQKYIADVGMYRMAGLQVVSNAYCIADSMKSVVVNPEGKLGLCEHYTDSEMIGDIYHDDYDYDVISSWCHPLMTEECKTCVFFPQCRIIKKCPVGRCNDEYRRHWGFQVRRSMHATYERWKVKNNKL